MNAIFISYRRADIPYALLVYNQLGATFGTDRVFRDIEDVAPGEDFVARIHSVLDECRAVVALIGQGWMRGRARLARRSDFVRLELLLALEKGLPVFPITVGGAKMPGRNALPPALAPFSRLNAIPITDYRFPSDLDTLVAALKRKVRPARKKKAEAPAPTSALTDEVSALQIRAVGLIEQGEIAAAQRTLRAGWRTLMASREQHEPDARFQLQLGYLHKTIAQAFDAGGKRVDADRHMALAAGSFAYVERQGEAGALSTADLAGALNGLGNVHSYRGESTEAIQCYRRAVQLLPGYAYAWQDLLLELLSQGGRSSPDLQELERVLDRLRATGRHVEGLGEHRIAWFEREVAKVTSRGK